MFDADPNFYDSPLDTNDLQDSRSLAVKIIGPNKRVLELGAATGRVTAALKANGCEVIAVERDATAARRLREICPVIEGDVEQISLERHLDSAKFDVVLAGDFLEHLQDPVELLIEVRQFIGPGGFLLSSIPNISHGSVRLGLLNGKFEYGEKGILDRTHLRFFTLDSIRQMFTEAGYRIECIQRLSADPFVEPFTGRQAVEPAKIAPEVRRSVEDDTESATVQFMIRAVSDGTPRTVRKKAELGEQLAQLEDRAREQEEELKKLCAERPELVRRAEETQATLEAVINSIGWKALNRARDFRGRWLPTGSLRHKLYLRAMQPVRRRLHASGAARADHGPRTYERWLATHEHPPAEPAKEIAAFLYKPKISIITPVYNPAVRWLRKCVESVLSQSYPDWQLCLCDDASTDPEVKEVLQEYAAAEPRIALHTSRQNQGISLASNNALSLAAGEFIALLDHDDELNPHALFWAVKLLQGHQDSDVIYSDEDKLELDGTRSEPFFKPEWSPEYLESCMYTGHLTLYRRALVEQVGGFRAGYEGSQDHDLMLRVTQRTKSIHHIPKILYHWRKAEGSAAGTSDAKPYAFVAARKALTDYASSKFPGAQVTEGAHKGQFRVKYPVNVAEKVSIIIPTRDKMAILKTCIDSIASKTLYPNYEIIIVDNNSAEPRTREYLNSLPYRVIPFNEEFNFSKLNNFAAREATGKYLLFLNNDTEVISGEWMTAMLEWCQQPEIGAVGAKLIYPNQTIQHAGVVLGLGGVAGHALAGLPKDTPAYFGVSHMIRNWAAVTAACMMVRRETFDSVGGFDEHLKVAFNDVDFCLRLLKRGLRNLVTPFAQLYHHESASRGFSLDPQEVGYMKRTWGPLLDHDPYYNPNLTLHGGDFGLRW
ncbi:MAG: glycosyltransferase [Terriglobales bacterium]